MQKSCVVEMVSDWLISCVSRFRLVVLHDVEWSVAVALISMYSVGMFWSATLDSPTMLEPAFLASGVYSWECGEFDVFRVNPPLTRLVGSLPSVLLGCETDWTGYDFRPGGRPEFALGRTFALANGLKTQTLVVYGRWCIIPFGIAGIAACFHLGRMLGGSGVGILASTLWCLDPTFAGHGHLMTTDVPAAAITVVVICEWLNWIRESQVRSLRLGLAIGIGLLTKFTLVLVIVSCATMSLCMVGYWLVNRQSSRALLSIRSAAVVSLIALLIVNCGYAFKGTGRRLDSLTFVSATLNGTSIPGALGNRFRKTILAGMPIPVPDQFVLGIDQQKLDHEQYPSDSYLHGVWRTPGWWYYYIYAFSVKSTIGWLSLLGVCCVAGGVHAIRTGIRFDWDALASAGTAIFIVIVASSQTAFTNHYRYLLPTLALLFPVVAKQIVMLGRRYQACFWMFVTCVGLAGIEAASTFPQGLSYFNWLSGGSSNGPKLLLHSNSDWGQDLLRLKAQVARLDDDSQVFLTYWGPCSPHALGISEFSRRWRDKPKTENVWWFISQNCIHGDFRNAFIDGEFDESLVHAKIRDIAGRRPDLLVGDSIVGYRVNRALLEALVKPQIRDR